jgi:hypothetical protein
MAKKRGRWGDKGTKGDNKYIVDRYLCTGFSLNSYAKDTSGYIVGTLDISD